MIERLEGERVVVRRARAEDAGPLAQAFADDPRMGVALGVEEDPTEDQLRADFGGARDAETRLPPLAIADAGSDAPLGLVFVHSIDRAHRRCEVGFFLVRAARGMGLADEALRLVIDWLFGDGFERIEMTTTPDNRGVFGLAERLGFAHEGTLRRRNLERGVRVDVAWFGLLRP